MAENKKKEQGIVDILSNRNDEAMSESHVPTPGDLYKLQRQTDKKNQNEITDRILLGEQKETEELGPLASDPTTDPRAVEPSQRPQERETLAPIKKPKQPRRIPTQPQPVTPVGDQSAEEDKDVGILNFVEWLASPLMAVGDAALMPIAHEYESESTLGKAVEAFQVSGRAFWERIFPDLNNLPEDPGMILAERITSSDTHPAVKNSIALTLNVLTDPTTSIGIPALKVFQNGLRSAQTAAVGTDGVWTLGLKDVMGVLQVSDIPAVQAAKTIDMTRRRLVQAGLTAPIASKFSRFAGGGFDSLVDVVPPNVEEAQGIMQVAGQLSDLAYGRIKQFRIVDGEIKGIGEGGEIVDLLDGVQKILRRHFDAQEYTPEQIAKLDILDTTNESDRDVLEVVEQAISSIIDDKKLRAFIREHGVDEAQDALINKNPLLSPVARDEFGTSGFLDSADEFLRQPLDQAQQSASSLAEVIEIPERLRPEHLKHIGADTPEALRGQESARAQLQITHFTRMRAYAEEHGISKAYEDLIMNNPRLDDATKEMLVEERVIEYLPDYAVRFGHEQGWFTYEEIWGVMSPDMKKAVKRPDDNLARRTAKQLEEEAQGKKEARTERAKQVSQEKEAKELEEASKAKPADIKQMKQELKNLRNRQAQGEQLSAGELERIDTLERQLKHVGEEVSAGPSTTEQVAQTTKKTAAQISDDPQIKKMFELAKRADQGDKDALGRLNQIMESEFGTRLARAKAEREVRQVMPVIEETLGRTEEPLIRGVVNSEEIIPESIMERLTKRFFRMAEEEASRGVNAKEGTRAKIRFFPKKPLSEQPKRSINQMRDVAEHVAREGARLGDRPTTIQERIYNKLVEESRDELREAIEKFGEAEVRRVVVEENPKFTPDRIKVIEDAKLFDTSFAPAQRTTLKGVLREHLGERRAASLAENVLIRHTKVNYTKLNNLADIDELVDGMFTLYKDDLPEIFSDKNLTKEVKVLKGAKTADEAFAATESVADELVHRLDPTAKVPDEPGVQVIKRKKKMTQAESDAYQQTVIEDLLGRKLPKRSDKENYVWRQIILDSARRIRELATKVEQVVGKNEADEIALLKSIYVHKILTEKLTGVNPRSSAAALETLTISATTPAGRLAELRRLAPIVNEARKTQKIFNSLASSSSDRAITQMVEKMFRASVPDVLYEVFVNNILSGPVTHAINISSNATMMLMRPTERVLQAASAAVFGRTKEAAMNIREAQVMLSAIVETFQDWIKLRGIVGDNAVHMPEELKRLHELYQVRHHPSISAEALNLSGSMGIAADYIGKAIRLPGDFLLTEDMAYKMLHYRMAVNEQALRMATAKGGTAQEVRNYYNLLRRHPTQAMSSKGVDLAAYNTFTSSLGQKAGAFNRMRNSVWGVRWILPFFNTPTNIVKRGVRDGVLGNAWYDILGATKTDTGLKFDYTAFKNTPEGDLARAKVAIGSMMTGGLVMALGFDDDGFPRVTGPINQNTPFGKFMTSKGIPPYSIKVGDEWYSYEGLEPLKTVLGLITGYRDAINHLDFEDDPGGEIATELAMTAMTPFIKVVGDNYLFPQIQQVVWILESTMVGSSDQDREASTSYGARFFKRLGASMLVPNLFSQLKSRGGFLEGTPGSALYDPVFRQAETMMQTIQARIPGLSQYLPGYIDLWGEERTMPQGWGPDIVSPVSTLTPSDDPIDKMIINMGRLQLLSLPGNKKEIRGVRMDLWEREQYAKLVGKGIPERGVPPLKEVLRQVTENRIFKNLPIEGQAAIIKQQINNRRRMIDGYMISTNKAFREKFIKHQQQEALKFKPQVQVQ